MTPHTPYIQDHTPMTSVPVAKGPKAPASNTPLDPSYTQMGKILKLLPKLGRPELLYVAGRIGELLSASPTTHVTTQEAIAQLTKELGQK